MMKKRICLEQLNSHFTCECNMLFHFLCINIIYQALLFNNNKNKIKKIQVTPKINIEKKKSNYQPEAS